MLCGEVGRLALRSEEVRREGVGGEERDAARREAPDERCLGMVLVGREGVAGVKLMGKGGAGASKNERYEISGPPRRLTGTSIGAPLTCPTSCRGRASGLIAVTI